MSDRKHGELELNAKLHGVKLKNNISNDMPTMSEEKEAALDKYIESRVNKNV